MSQQKHSIAPMCFSITAVISSFNKDYHSISAPQWGQCLSQDRPRNFPQFGHRPKAIQNITPMNAIMAPKMINEELCVAEPMKNSTTIIAQADKRRFFAVFNFILPTSCSIQFSSPSNELTVFQRQFSV
ncbi:hypothetical protein [Pseudoflavonifractor phocaeensis]|uniref:hypothetical protein n=1 Tax=Pseudoflavonifractor phocaeensis TaxID=1870988 RepID=UPI00195AC6C0|nr:hypothetical protein [Pseudoflavonifractor phocaeensis]MBM6885276.1 hypothetical protein [Pseudoflavonifractor phocaeensis]